MSKKKLLFPRRLAITYLGHVHNIPKSFSRRHEKLSGTVWKVKAQTAGTYSGFISMKHLGVLLLPPGRDASPSQGYPPAVYLRYPFIHLGEERQSGVKFLVQGNNATLGLEPWTSRSRVWGVNHSATHASTTVWKPVRYLTLHLRLVFTSDGAGVVIRSVELMI